MLDLPQPPDSLRTSDDDAPEFTGGVRPLDGDIRARVAAIGLHPFLLVRIQREHGPARDIVCNTQNELASFVDELASVPELDQWKLLRGLERALRLETYEAADCWFSWVREAANGAGESIHLDPRSDNPGPDHGYPVFAVGAPLAGDGAQRRAAVLVDLFEAYCRTNGNNATRFILAEALAFALSRCLGARGEYSRAAAIVDKALALGPSSIHLKAARAALGFKLDGKMVPDRLVKFIGEDNGYLKQFVCPHPFQHFEIGPSGDVRVCCGHWVPTTIGNLLEDSVEGILNSRQAQKLRASMTDGSYKYCNHLDCGHMIRGTLPIVEELPRPATRNAVATGDYRMHGIDHLNFGLDQSCNLSCPSCRTQVIVEKVSASTEKTRAVAEKLIEVLPTVRFMQINPAGEVFASKPSRKLLELINDERCPDLQIEIISNGTLFSEEEWNRFPGIHNKVWSVRISTDAARKETFEKLRRLAKWDSFLESVRFLARLRAAGIIHKLKFSFTYQLDNFREMPQFVEFCASMNGDYAIFERLQNIVFSWDEFRQKAVHHPEHPLHREFLAIVGNPIFASARVSHDFDYEGAAKLTTDEARRRAALSYPGSGAR